MNVMPYWSKVFSLRLAQILHGFTSVMTTRFHVNGHGLGMKWDDIPMARESRGAGSFWDDEKEPIPNQSLPAKKKSHRYGVLGIWDAKTPKQKKEAWILLIISQCIPPFLTAPILGIIVIHAMYKERLRELEDIPPQ